MNLLLTGQANKAVAAVLAAAATLLQHWAGDWWEPPVVALLGALSVFLISNSGASTVSVTPVVPPAKLAPGTYSSGASASPAVTAPIPVVPPPSAQ